MYVFQCASQFCNPETHCLFCERFSGNVKAKVTARHQIDDKVSGQKGQRIVLDVKRL